jgi:AraC-like DNA-binding protein
MDDPRFDVDVHHAALQRFEAPWRWSHLEPVLDWPGYILWTVLEGGATMYVGRRRYEIAAGDVVLMDMTLATNHFQVTADHGLAIMEWIHFTYRTQPDALPPVHRRIRQLGFWDQLVQRATQAHYARGHWPGFDRRWMAALLQELHHQDHHTEPTGGPNRKRAWQIHQLCREIRMNPGKVWSLDEMAGRLSLSVGHFARVFEQYRGAKPGEFVISARIDAAKDLLRMSTSPIKELAQRLGYCDAFAFSRQFSARVGVSPSAYRHSSGAAREEA